MKLHSYTYQSIVYIYDLCTSTCFWYILTITRYKCINLLMLNIVPRKYILRRCYIILLKSERERGEMFNHEREVKFIHINTHNQKAIGVF